MFPILILLVPLIGALTINYYSKNERIVKYFPLIVSFVVSLIIIIYTIFNDLSHERLIGTPLFQAFWVLF